MGRKDLGLSLAKGLEVTVLCRDFSNLERLGQFSDDGFHRIITIEEPFAILTSYYLHKWLGCAPVLRMMVDQKPDNP